MLARLVLAGWGLAPSHGVVPGSTFLFRTPEAIEEGIRQNLRTQLGDRWQIRKKGMTLAGTRSRVLNPDLLFEDDLAVGDVKYQRNDGTIKRSHLSQVTTFAAGYRARRAAVIAFGPRSAGEHVEVGDIAVDAFNWDTSLDDPGSAASTLAEEINAWLTAAAIELKDQRMAVTDG